MTRGIIERAWPIEVLQRDEPDTVADDSRDYLDDVFEANYGPACDCPYPHNPAEN